MSDYKLVVMSPFNNYRRGSEIRDQVIVNSILDKSNSMHSFSANCRKVKLLEVDKQQYIPNEPENKQPEPENQSQPEIPKVNPNETEIQSPEDVITLKFKDENTQKNEPLDSNELLISSVKSNENDANVRLKNSRRKR